MNKELAIVLAASIGGLLGFLSSYLTIKLQLRNVQKAAFFERRFDAFQFVGLFLFRPHKGEEIFDHDWNQFISFSYLLPVKLRNLCWQIASDKENMDLISGAEKEIMAFIDHLEK